MSGCQRTEDVLADYNEIIVTLDAAIDRAYADAAHAKLNDAVVTAEADEERAEFLERALSFVQLAKRTAENGEAIERRWTVVCARPDYINGDAANAAEEVMIAIVDAYNPLVAAGKARAQLAHEVGDEDAEQLAEDFATLRVFEGDLTDHYLQGHLPDPHDVEHRALTDELGRIELDEQEREAAGAAS